ncbi:MAG: hypothetical protein HeimC3_06450 [Candidatus Heimdallarchaeota archaeon LC_3]|nr:MAG: hypothetical protein HeimC3_06450 [Candidatus Heimdallarchaeota archaeon LC_3]
MNRRTENDIIAVFVFKSDSGTLLFSRKNTKFDEDLFSAFLSALKSFFSSFTLGGLSSFASDNYIVYLISIHNLLTSIIVDKQKKSEKYYLLGNEVSESFYDEYKSIVDSTAPLIRTDYINFDNNLDEILRNFNSKIDGKKDLIKFYQIDNRGFGKQFGFISIDHLYTLPIFVVVNLITNEIFVLENDETISRKIVFNANKFASNVNQREYKSMLKIKNTSGPWDCERLINEFSDVLTGRAIEI